MLSPPPSPRPSSSQPFAFDAAIPVDIKKSVGRRYKLFVILVPALIVLLTASAHYPILLTVDWHFGGSVMTHPPHLPHTPPPVAKRQLPSSQPSPSSTASSSVPPVPTDPPTAAGVVPTPFPQPFDISLSWNFTSVSCQNFFLNFTQLPSFRKCRPLSLLLDASSQFASSQNNATLLTDIMWGTCNTPTTADECDDVMKDLASNIQTDCKTELQQKDTLPMEALGGFQLYSAVRQAGCVVDQSTGSYCFVEAATNPASSDIEFFRLPTGVPLSNGTIPSCSTCIKDVMAIYAQAITTPSSAKTGTSVGTPLDTTYGPAAQLAVQQCGSVYAQQVNVSAASPACDPAFMSRCMSLVTVLTCIIVLLS